MVRNRRFSTGIPLNITNGTTYSDNAGVGKEEGPLRIQIWPAIPEPTFRLRATLLQAAMCFSNTTLPRLLYPPG